MAKQLEGVTGKGPQILMVKFSSIVVQDGWNTRNKFPEERELMESIAQNGVSEPLKVRVIDNEIRLVNGERRLRATIRAFNEGMVGPDFAVPCIFLQGEQASDIEAMYEMFITNDGKRFEPLEEAELFRRLRAHDIEASEIARRVGRSSAHVNRMLKLVGASPSVKADLRDGKIGVKEAQRIAGKAGTYAEQNAALEKTRKEKDERIDGRGRMPAALEIGKKLVETVVGKEKRVYGIGGLFDAVISNNEGVCYIVYNRARHEKMLAQFSSLVSAEIVEVVMPMAQDEFQRMLKRLPKGGVTVLIFKVAG